MKKKILITLMITVMTTLPMSFAQQYKRATEASEAQNLEFELIPVKFSKNKSSETFEFEGKQYLALGKPLILKNFKYQTSDKNDMALMLELSAKDAKKLEKLTRKHINNKLALRLNNEVLMVPEIKSIISGGHLQISLNDSEKFQDLLGKMELN